MGSHKKRLEEQTMSKEKIKQKLSGIVLVIVGILSVLPEHDATFALLVVPLGLYVTFTKEQVMYV